ncbi:MAG: hypothetical protein BGO52_19405 [Sphingobacteriales bacterium 44-61]|nr:MAG: hypothetical protein BGO52_19405 [Sphingobacteriales bacterium 44-61]
MVYRVVNTITKLGNFYSRGNTVSCVEQEGLKHQTSFPFFPPSRLFFTGEGFTGKAGRTGRDADCQLLNDRLVECFL